MVKEKWLQYGGITVSVMILITHLKGMKKYIAVGLFASLYANVWCYIAMYNRWWEFKHKLFPKIKDISISVNMIAVPIMAMFWVRYCPVRLREKIWWAFSWTSILTFLEYNIKEHTKALKYKGGYRWYHSYLLWFVSWFVWLGFHRWINNGERKIESMFET